MSDLVKKNVFVDDGTKDRSVENFQNYQFFNLNFENRPEPISFFRSDFRSVKMDGVVFFRNNFDHADFVNAYIARTQFKDCVLSTDFFNSVFVSTLFRDNLTDISTVYNCYYENCQFENERVINTCNRDSTYKSCRFERCTFEINSFNDLNFIDCSFVEIDFSNMGAYDLTFENCQFESMTLDPDYFGSYLFKNTSISDVTLAYRGKAFNLAGNLSSDLQSLAIFYQENLRYYEAFNTTLLFRFYTQKPISIIKYFERIIQLILNDTNTLIQQQQLLRVIKTITFYADSSLLKMEEIFYFIGYFKALVPKNFTLKEKIGFINSVELLEKMTEAYLFNFNGSEVLKSNNDKSIARQYQVHFL